MITISDAMIAQALGHVGPRFFIGSLDGTTDNSSPHVTTTQYEVVRIDCDQRRRCACRDSRRRQSSRWRSCVLSVIARSAMTRHHRKYLAADVVAVHQEKPLCSEAGMSVISSQKKPALEYSMIMRFMPSAVGLRVTVPPFCRRYLA